ncbi:hypothetical protein F3F96_06720 [Mariprofundus sp. NF]|uniref:hypothetical protein n=1 Tax=Mariprofundus sp. NF TaxID=2608716 RepID=UPI0015A27782|nr:hypothetical protein [Mariprofundus sp. NF]NWF38825.1 hypothetical protein [Mariprofundus sp. NF]
MKIFSMVLAMVFALSLNVAPAMADSKSNDSRSSDSRSKDKRSDDSSSDSRSKVKSDRRDYQRSGVDTRDVRRPDNRNAPADRTFPDWWPFY